VDAVDRAPGGAILVVFGDIDAGGDEVGALVDVVGAFHVEGEAGVAELEVAGALLVGEADGEGFEEDAELVDLGRMAVSWAAVMTMEMSFCCMGGVGGGAGNALAGTNPSHVYSGPMS
jgi:hypothetical protein